jgi:fructose-1,6-bisphosphatase I
MDFIYTSFKKISDLLKYDDLEKLTKIVGINSSKDNRNKLDEISNYLVIEALKKHDNIIGFISEENNELVFVKSEEEINKMKHTYLLFFDPLDGSKNVENNVTVGTIYCLIEYNYNNDTLNNIIEAGYCLYGTRTLLIKTHKEKVLTYLLNSKNEFEYVNEIYKPINSSLYCINSSHNYDENINTIIEKAKKEKYNMRWIGSMVADCHQVLLKGGIFMYPNTEKSPNGKIRLLYEAVPLSYIFSLLGGNGLNCNNENILDIIKTFKIKKDNIHQKTPIILYTQDNLI